jgi:hypothetical protein
VITVPADAPEEFLTKAALDDVKVKATIAHMEASIAGKAKVKAVINAKNLTNVVVQIVSTGSDAKKGS